jgi:starvation-inducible DNA-binding protein
MMDSSSLVGGYSPSFNGGMVRESGELEVENQGASLEELIRQMMSLSSYTNKLYLQSHLIHLNIEGPLFFPLHEFFKEQYESHISNFDLIAELIRSMNYLMPMCEKGLNSVCPMFNHVTSYEPRNMVTTYIQNIEQFGMAAKQVGETAEAAEAPDAENKMADLVNFAFKSSWMLKATLRR